MTMKGQPAHYHLLFKTHKLTIFLTASPWDTVASLKEEALLALTAQVNGVDEIPKATTVDDFELCKLKDIKSKQTPPEYVPLDPSLPIKSHVSNWEVLFVQFKDESGNPIPIKVSQPSLTYDDDEEGGKSTSHGQSLDSINKGKRKAPEE